MWNYSNSLFWLALNNWKKCQSFNSDTKTQNQKILEWKSKGPQLKKDKSISIYVKDIRTLNKPYLHVHVFSFMKLSSTMIYRQQFAIQDKFQFRLAYEKESCASFGWNINKCSNEQNESFSGVLLNRQIFGSYFTGPTNGIRMPLKDMYMFTSNTRIPSNKINKMRNAWKLFVRWLS